MLTDREIILTRAGLKKIEDELEHLQTHHRREVADRIRESRQYGDLAEMGGNAEYEEAKAEQALVEGRILELKRILSNARVVDESEVPTDVVGIGSVVTVRDLESNAEWDWEIVGPVEADPEQFRISYESPVGRALVGKRPGDEVKVSVPAGVRSYKIVGLGK
jgi:transcription elongation factor GreA